MKFLSVCSGIEAASCAWGPLGWNAHAFSEIEAFPSSVLAHHYPETPNWGDMTKFKEWPDADIDVLVGGTPCQSFSVAGLRKGLADPRGNLALTFLAIAAKYAPRWILWENVPGVLSSDGGRDFGAFLGGLGQLGYGWAFRVLDAQHFGVPQRRRRVFVVGHLGDWRRAAAVLFERHSLSGNPPPRREKGQVAPTIPSRSTGGGGLGTDFDCDGGLIASTGDIAHCLNAGGMGRQDYETETPIAHSLRGEGFDASEDGTGRGTPLVPVQTVIASLELSNQGSGGNVGWHGPDRPTKTLDTNCPPGVALSFAIQAGATRENPDSGPDGVGVRDDGVAYTLEARAEVQAVAWSIMPQNSGKDYKARQVDVAQPLMAGGPVGGNQGGDFIQMGDAYAGAYEANAASALRTLRQKVGAEAVAEWGLRILDALQSPEVLRSWLHGGSIRDEAEAFRRWVDDRALPREEGSAAVTLRKLWEQGPDGCSSQGRGLAKQLAHQLGQTLPQLPPARPQGGASAVRRLTPEECEKLQGFPPGYTLVPHRGKPAADGPRYKALGNSMAVPVMRWIGERIQMVEALSDQQAAA